LCKPGVGFFWNVTKIARVDAEGGVVGSSQGCLREGVNLTVELLSIHGCRGQLLEQCSKHGLALLGGHDMVGVLEDLDQHRRLLVL
jgi:hypothetical protein